MEREAKAKVKVVTSVWEAKLFVLPWKNRMNLTFSSKLTDMTHTSTRIRLHISKRDKTAMFCKRPYILYTQRDTTLP